MRISHFKAHVWLFADMFKAVKVFKVGTIWLNPLD